MDHRATLLRTGAVMTFGAPGDDVREKGALPHEPDHAGAKQVTGLALEAERPHAEPL
jgi:hypothetical protein